MKEAAGIEPYLFFGGRCDDALAFYAKALGAKTEFLMCYSDKPGAVPPGVLPPGFEDKVMHATVRLGAATFQCSDGHKRGGGFEGFRLSLELPDGASVDAAAKALAAGGSVELAPAETFWAPRFAMVTDKFGVGWMLTAKEK